MPDFAWNETAGRFRDRATGQFVPEAHVRAGVDAVIDKASQHAGRLATGVKDGTDTVETFQREMFRAIKDVHISSALAAYGGRDAMTSERWGYVGSRIKAQYQYMRGFVSDIIDGTQPMDGRIVVRAQMYMDAGRITYEAVRARESLKRGFTEERNVLHAQESCRQCVELASRGWVPTGSLPPIGTRICLVRCKCTIDRRAAVAA